MIQRYLFKVIFIQHEEFTPRRMYTPSRGGVQGGLHLLWGLGGDPPDWGVWGQASPRRKNFLVNVYCNFIVNMDCSLQDRRYDNRSYVRVFFPRRQPSFMRKMYCDYASL
jgi:hypothetical protein